MMHVYKYEKKDGKQITYITNKEGKYITQILHYLFSQPFQGRRNHLGRLGNVPTILIATFPIFFPIEWRQDNFLLGTVCPNQFFIASAAPDLIYVTFFCLYHQCIISIICPYSWRTSLCIQIPIWLPIFQDKGLIPCSQASLARI